MVCESTRDDTLKAIRAGKLALMVPVMMLVVGRWVAITMCMPTARASCAMQGYGQFYLLARRHYEVAKLVYNHHDVGHVAVSLLGVELTVDELVVIFLDIAPRGPS